MTPGLWILLAAVVLALGFGGYRALTDGRFRGTHAVRGARASAVDSPPVGDQPAVVEVAETPVVERAETPAETTWAHVAAAVPDAQLGEKATLVQFSSAFCAPCRVTRRTLGEVAEAVPGVVHLEIDAEHHLDLVRHVGVLRTPTTLVLDAGGHEVTRAAGAPKKEQVLAALAAATRG
ncbi:thioredoxin family protein [Nocardioides ferulae]|uniref:thioredoxin family protein n=1 Tax=Nocardioides ferulae TaxID=2340821 RepID=UPI000EB47999|nr:thioredoxin family protein [Nocardioides ferulae]